MFQEATDQSTRLEISARMFACPACESRDIQPFLAAPDRFNARHDLYSLKRCTVCSLVWIAAPPSPEEIGRHYGTNYDRSIGDAGEKLEHWVDRRDVLLRHKSGGAVLDLGCNSGGFLSSLKGPSWKLYGVEMSENAARRAKLRCGAQVFVGDVLDAPFAPNSFDAITCFHVFEHMYHPREVLARVSEWLKPGGIFYAMVPNIDSVGAHIFKSYWYALELPRHLFHFSPKSLSYLGRSVGLRELSVTTHRELFFEQSTRYVVDGLCRKVGISRRPSSDLRPPGIPWKVVRKGFRLTVLPVLNAVAGFAGDGESIHAILEKKI